MKTTTLHGHNSAREAREVFNDNRRGISVYRVNAGYIASFWMRRDGAIYAEETFETQGEAEAAAREIAAQDMAAAQAEARRPAALALALDDVSQDNCRVYYRSPSRRLYCIQDETCFGRPAFKFYRCSQDGEPSYEVTGYPFSDLAIEYAFRMGAAA